MVPEGGRLFVPPAYMQTTGDQAVQLDSATDGIAFGFPVECDYELSAISAYITAVGTEGNVNITLHADGTAYEPNGRYNGSTTTTDPTMTANNLPAPYVVGLYDSAGANAEAGAGYEAFKAMDGLVVSDNGTRSNAAPTALAPIYFVIDAGVGNTLPPFNKYRFTSFNNADANVRAFPKAWTVWEDDGTHDIHTDNGWTQVTMSAAATSETDPGASFSREYYLSATTTPRRRKWKFTDRNGANAYMALGEVAFFSAQLAQAPGTQLLNIGTLGSGAAADAWVKKSFSTAYQTQRGTFLWLKFLGTAAKDFSLSTRRWNAAMGSMFPDGCITKTSTETGVWSQAEQDGKPALMNIVLNSTANHCPKLYYGRHTGAYDYIPGVGVVAIPQAGISLACDDLTATSLTDLPSATAYNVDLDYTGGTLALLQYTTAITTTEGILQGDANRRYLGTMWIINRISTKQGPIDVLDARLVRMPGRRKSIGKYNPYAGATTQTVNPAMVAIPIGSSPTDFTVVFGSFAGEYAILNANAIQSGTTANTLFFMDIDGYPPLPVQGSVNYTSPDVGSVRIRRTLSPGIHSATPYATAQTTATVLRLWYGYGANINSQYASQMHIDGEVA
jgi:hypothetical protein